MTKSNNTITLSQLQKLGACKSQLSLFKKRFGESVTLTEEIVLANYGDFNINWSINYLLTTSQKLKVSKELDNEWAELANPRAEYDKARDEFDKAVAKCDKAKAELNKARAEYDKAWVEWRKACAEYDKSRALAFFKNYTKGD